MTAIWHSASSLFDGFELHADHAISVENGKVTGLTPIADLPVHLPVTHHDCILSPGFFDIQVNGGGGVLVNSDPTRDGIAKICAAHKKFGTTALLPTVITDRPEVTERAVEACLAAQDIPGMRGLHIEGPHLSKTRRGTHDGDLIRDMDARTKALVERLRAQDVPVLITVAPEASTGLEVAELVEMGAVVSIGHSDARAQDVRGHLDAGATAFTHLFNAMSPMLGRAPGVVGAAISSDVWCSIIADGIHVDPQMVQLAFRARPKADRMIAISDAMPTVGGPESFELYGQVLRLEDGKLVNGEGSLAGAHLTMVEAVRNLVRYGVPMEDALRAGVHNPAQLMGLWPDMGLIGSRAGDLVVLSADLDLVSVGLDASG